MKQNMTDLHSVGGNYARIFLMNFIFSPEWVNLGVYDAFKEPPVCSTAESAVPWTSLSSGCVDDGFKQGHTGNCQWQAWAFDQILDNARDNDIYIQLCIDPYPPII